MEGFDALLSAHASKQKSGPSKGDSRKRVREHSVPIYTENEYDRKRKRALEKKIPKEVIGRNLVIVCAGDTSLHESSKFPWHGSKGFDLCIVYYGSDENVKKRFEGQSKFFFQKRGPKWQLVRHALKNCDWKEYEYIWLPDDDLEMDPELIVKMFDIAAKYMIRLGQPALFDENIQPKYKHVIKKRDGAVLHFTNFVEIMCPFLRVDALEAVFHTLDSDEAKSGWGLDMLWPTLLDFRDIAVFDATPVRHTRPQNAFNVTNSFYKEFKIDPQREYFDLKRKHRFNDFKIRVISEIPDKKSSRRS
uniref:Uncharacterized protein n=1 Tax=Mucochytrium quahogii TaxID=96639 RepID=A0A7S2RRN6_9STRA|mmetsp:Transcript_6709/g.10601  ORF Transcript_6709/g.10601 Transcript_6709/m.10601 type:complete len:304 (-) Transcript_6709:62-973(-)